MMKSVKLFFFKSVFHLIFQDLPPPLFFYFFRHCDIEQDMLHYDVDAAARH